jgi:hypothetical protein
MDKQRPLDVTVLQSSPQDGATRHIGTIKEKSTMTKFMTMTMQQLLEYLNIPPEETTASTYLYTNDKDELVAIEKHDRTSRPIDEDVALGYAWMWETEETLPELARRTNLSYRVLALKAANGKLQARKSGGVWLSTVAAIEHAIHYGYIRRSSQVRKKRQHHETT